MSITWTDFAKAATNEEGFKVVVAECRMCGADVMALAQWGATEVQIMSSGVRPGCENAKCGDKMPCHAKRMAQPDEVAVHKIKFAAHKALAGGLDETELCDALMLCDTVSDIEAAISAAMDLQRFIGGGVK